MADKERGCFISLLLQLNITASVVEWSAGPCIYLIIKKNTATPMCYTCVSNVETVTNSRWFPTFCWLNERYKVEPDLWQAKQRCHIFTPLPIKSDMFVAKYKRLCSKCILGYQTITLRFQAKFGSLPTAQETLIKSKEWLKSISFLCFCQTGTHLLTHTQASTHTHTLSVDHAVFLSNEICCGLAQLQGLLVS